MSSSDQINNELTFSVHINKLFMKCTRKIIAIAHLLNHLNKECKMAVHKALVQSNLNYCSIIYHHCSLRNAKKLESINKHSLCYLCNDIKSSACQLTLNITREKLILFKIVFKIIHSLLQPLDNSFMHVQRAQHTTETQVQSSEQWIMTLTFSVTLFMKYIPRFYEMHECCFNFQVMFT